MHTNKLKLFFLLSIAMHLELIASNNNDSDSENKKVTFKDTTSRKKLIQSIFYIQLNNSKHPFKNVFNAMTSSSASSSLSHDDELTAAQGLLLINQQDNNTMNSSSSSAIAPDVLPVSINALKELSKEDILKYCKSELNQKQISSHLKKNKRAYELYNDLISAGKESDIPDEIIQFSYSYQHEKQQQQQKLADIESTGCAKWLEEYYQIKPNFDLENCSLQDFCPSILREACLKLKFQGIDTLSSQERSDADFYEKFYRSTSNLSWIKPEQNNDLTNQRKVAYEKQQSFKSLPLEEQLLAKQHVSLKERLLAEQHAYRKAEMSLYSKKRRLDSPNSTDISQNN